MSINCFSTESIIETGKETLGITDFLNSAEEYTSEVFEDINLNELFSDLSKGKFSTTSIKTKILRMFSNELLKTAIIMIDILIVIIIHSILNAIIEDLSNSNTGKIAYFIQYGLFSLKKLTETTLKDAFYYAFIITINLKLVTSSIGLSL